MKILYLSCDPVHHPSHEVGYGTHIRKVIEELKARGHEVYPCIAGIPLNKEEGQQSQSGSRLKKIVRGVVPGRLWEWLKVLRLINHDRYFYRIVLGAVEKFSPDIIYERQTYLHKCGVEVAKVTGVPLVVEVNNPFCPPEEERISKDGRHILNRQAINCKKEVFNNAAQVVVVSTAFKRYLIEELRIKSDKIHVITNAVDSRSFDPEIVNGDKIRNQYRLAEYPVIGFVGSFSPWHGLEDLLEVAAKLKERVLEFRILLVGDGYIRRDLETLVKKLRIEKNVVFSGSVSPDLVPQYIAAMDICVQANANWYMSPIKLFEYGAMGKPIVAPRTDPVQELINNGKDGLLVSNQDELEYSLYRFLMEPEFASSCGENFQKRILNEYTWQHVAKKLEELFLRSRTILRKTG